MPFIKGRYHINPIVGAALEAAREAEEAAAFKQQSAHDADSEKAGSPDDQKSRPIHRVEIEAAEVGPAHSGSAQRGFVARIHRGAAAEPQASSGSDADFFDTPESAGHPIAKALSSTKGVQPPETQVFSNHEDLVDFLRSEFERDCQR